MLPASLCGIARRPSSRAVPDRTDLRSAREKIRATLGEHGEPDQSAHDTIVIGITIA